MIKTGFFYFVSTLFMVVWLLATPAIQAATPELITDLTNKPVSKDRVYPVYVYFHYGDPVGKKNINNLSISLELEGNGFEIDPEKVFDLYYVPVSGAERTAIPVCKNTYNGTEYQIDPKLITKNGIENYGPQSANEPLEPSGTTIAGLPAGRTGCIKIGLMVKKDAKNGQITTLTFDPDSRNSPAYRENEKPGLQIAKIMIGEEAETCEEGEEFAIGECRPICENNQGRDEGGDCVSTEVVCNGNEEKFDGKCLEKCRTGEERDSAGNCQFTDEGESSKLLNIIATPLVVITGLGFVVYLYFKFKGGRLF